MGDPTGLASWALGKALDTLIEHVKEARKYYDYCDDLIQLLERIAPLLSQAAAKSSSPAGDGSSSSSQRSAVDNWLMDLKLEVGKAEVTLQKALASNPSSYEIWTKKKYSDLIRDITERIRKVKSDGEGLATLAEVRDLHLKMDDLKMRGSKAADWKERDSEISLVSELTELRRRSAHDKRCDVKLEVADTHTQRFHAPDALMETSLLEIRQQGVGRLRRRAEIIARGGFEVNNETKLRLTIEVEFEEDWYFYILFVDASERSPPGLVFPVEAEDDSNSLNRMGARVFPDLAHYDYDPPTVKIVRSSNSPTDVTEKVSLYILILRNRLQSGGGGGSGALTIWDVQSHLRSLDDSDKIVKNWLFDIRPPAQNF